MPVRRIALVAKAQVVDELLGIGRGGVEGREQVERLADRDPIRELAFLELHTDEGPQDLPVRTWIVPEDVDRARVGCAKTGDRLDRRGLTGTVGSEDPEDLAFLDGER